VSPIFFFKSGFYGLMSFFWSGDLAAMPQWHTQMPHGTVTAT